MRAVQLFCWHFMAYPYLPKDFDQKYETGWVTVPGHHAALWRRTLNVEQRPLTNYDEAASWN